MNIVEKIKKHVETETKKPTSTYGPEPFECHFVPTVKYALELAEELGGDKEIVALAGWLHDIGAIMGKRCPHHLTGAKIAEEKLRKLNYPENRIKLIKKCIKNHRGSVQNERQSLEEKIVAEADAMSNFDNIAGIFKAAYIYENQTQIEAKKSTLKKLENKYKGLHFKKSKDIIRPKYEAAMLLLK